MPNKVHDARAELATVVASPAEDGAGRPLKRAREIRTRCDGRHARQDIVWRLQPSNRHWNGRPGYIGVPVSELSPAVVAPARDGRVGQHRAGMFVAHGDFARAMKEGIHIAERRERHHRGGKSDQSKKLHHESRARKEGMPSYRAPSRVKRRTEDAKRTRSGHLPTGGPWMSAGRHIRTLC